MMTIKEAVSLVITTLVLSSPGHLYMLDMGESIKIENLARELIGARGLRPGVDIEIIYTGLRPGERLTEELMGPDEGSRPTSHSAITEVISTNPLSSGDLDWTIERLRTLAGEGHADELLRALRKSVGGHEPNPGDEPSNRSMRSMRSMTQLKRPVPPEHT